MNSRAKITWHNCTALHFCDLANMPIYMILMGTQTIEQGKAAACNSTPVQYILREFKITLKLFGIISQKHQHQYQHQHQHQHQLSITILGTAQVDNIILKEVPDQIIPHS